MNVIWLPIPDVKTGRGVYWDTNLLELLLKDCDHSNFVARYETAIVIIPGAKAGKHIAYINREISALQHCKIIITSDEENKFPIDELEHPNMKIYANYYSDKYKADITWLPIGPATFQSTPIQDRNLDYVYAGQVNHASREKLIKRLKKIPKGEAHISDGFGKGHKPDVYNALLATANAVPAPSGHVSPDSFRFYEALENGAVPIPDKPEFWAKLLPDMPMTALKTWRKLDEEIIKCRNLQYRNECVAWWERKKLDIKRELIGDESDITVMIPASPIKSHPSIEIIQQTIESVRSRLPNSRIIITFDGVRKEQSAKEQQYQQHIQRLLWAYRNTNVYPVVFNEHIHQVGMARKTFDMIKTPYVVYVEQDTPLVGAIEWAQCKGVIEDGQADLVRFHFENTIPEPHEQLMHGEIDYDGVKFIITSQYSQRPHIMSRAFFERILNTFSEDARTFIEDGFYGIVESAWRNDGMIGWQNYRIVIYAPENGLKRSEHLDGRDGEKKYDKDLIF